MFQGSSGKAKESQEKEFQVFQLRVLRGWCRSTVSAETEKTPRVGLEELMGASRERANFLGKRFVWVWFSYKVRLLFVYGDLNVDMVESKTRRHLQKEAGGGLFVWTHFPTG